MRITAAALPQRPPDGAGFALIAEVDGAPEEIDATVEELDEALGEGAVSRYIPRARSEVELLWGWRDGVSIAATGVLGGKVSEDICVTVDRLAGSD